VLGYQLKKLQRSQLGELLLDRSFDQTWQEYCLRATTCANRLAPLILLSDQE